MSIVNFVPFMLKYQFWRCQSITWCHCEKHWECSGRAASNLLVLFPSPIFLSTHLSILRAKTCSASRGKINQSVGKRARLSLSAGKFFSCCNYNLKIWTWCMSFHILSLSYPNSCSSPRNRSQIWNLSPRKKWTIIGELISLLIFLDKGKIFLSIIWRFLFNIF